MFEERSRSRAYDLNYALSRFGEACFTLLALAGLFALAYMILTGQDPFSFLRPIDFDPREH